MRKRTLSKVITAAALVALGASAAPATAASLSMTFTESRANVGVQLTDAALFEAPAVAPLDAEMEAGTGSISAGKLTVPEFSTFVTDPVDADVAVEFEIGVVTGSFNHATGALTLEGEAGGTLTANGDECVVSTTPAILRLSTEGSSGGTSPRLGVPFNNGSTGSGAIAGQWTDMHATPVGSEDETVCKTVDQRIGGPGGVWLYQEGDGEPPQPPHLLSTTRPGIARVVGSAEPGSSVAVYANAVCAGAPVAVGSAAELGSFGLIVEVAEGGTAIFSATATDAAGNISGCSLPAIYIRIQDGPPPTPPACVVPKLVGKSLAQARRLLTASKCKVGKIHRLKPNGKGYFVRSARPGAGARSGSGEVNLVVGPKVTGRRR